MHPLRLESASAVTLLRFMSMMSPTRHIKRCWRPREQLCSVTKWLAATERLVNFVRLFQGHEHPFATRVLHVIPTFFGRHEGEGISGHCGVMPIQHIEQKIECGRGLHPSYGDPLALTIAFLAQSISAGSASTQVSTHRPVVGRK